MTPATVNAQQPFTMVPWTTLAFGVYGPYFNPTDPSRGRFATLPAYAAAITPLGVGFPMRAQGWA